MAANINDKLTAVMNGGQPVVTTVSTPRSAGVTTLSCVALTYWPTATKVHFITYRKTAAGNVDRATQQNWMGIVSGNTVTGLVKTDDAADAGNSAGDFVEMTPTAKWGQDLYDGLAASHDNDGTLKAGAVDNAAVLASDVVETAKIKDGAVTNTKLSTTAITLGYAEITSSFVSTGLVGLADITGLSVTVDVPAGGRRVKITGWASSVTCNNTGYFVDFFIREGSTNLAITSNPGRLAPGVVMYSTVASAGSHTYKLSHGVGASANVTTEASATRPAFILVELI